VKPVRKRWYHGRFFIAILALPWILVSPPQLLQRLLRSDGLSVAQPRRHGWGIRVHYFVQGPANALPWCSHWSRAVTRKSGKLGLLLHAATRSSPRPAGYVTAKSRRLLLLDFLRATSSGFYGCVGLKQVDSAAVDGRWIVQRVAADIPTAFIA